MEHNVINTVKEELRNGDHSTFKAVYKQHQNDFLKFSLRKGLPHEDVMEVYNDVLLAFHDNLVSNKLIELTSSLKTYLFGIGKNMIHKRLEKSAKRKIVEFHPNYENGNKEPIQDQENRQKLAVDRAISQLGDACQELLILYYYKRYSISAIRHTMEYKNENTVKAQKSRCMKKLRDLLNVKSDVR